MEQSNLPEVPPQDEVSLEEARAREVELLDLQTRAAAQEVADQVGEEDLTAGKTDINAENKRIEEATKGLAISRMVEYRSRTGNYSVPAVVNCTVNSIYQPGVEAGYVPALTSVDRVHLTVFTPGKPGLRVEADDFVVTSDEEVSENVSGCYQEWNIPYDANGGPGTWKWPTRVWRRTR